MIEHPVPALQVVRCVPIGAASKARQKEFFPSRITCTDEQGALNHEPKYGVPMRTLHQRGLDKRQTPNPGE